MSKQEDDLLVYDEDDAVKFILNFLASASDGTFDDTKIEYVLDVIYDFYDESGFIEEDSTEEASIDEEAMFKYIKKSAKTDKMNLTDDEIKLILEAEFEYGKSLGIYDEEE